MRGFAVLLAYVAGLSAVIGIGMMGLAALNKPTPSAAPVAAGSQKERLVKPVRQTTVAQKDAQPSQKRAHVARKRKKEEAPTFSSGFGAYGYAQESRRFYHYPSLFFSR
jgi:hypothetical protein